MSSMTITEALQEIKTINARLEKKRAGIMPYVVRDNRARDPFEAQGGSASYVQQERQSIRDLEHRLVKIRTEIQKSNLYSRVTVGDRDMTVSEWLTWRREVSSGSSLFVDSLIRGIQGVRDQMQKKGGRVTAVASAEINVASDAPPEAVVNVDELALMRERDEMQQTLGALDGKLSLFNATSYIEV